jgi:hypothetical protein
MTACQKCILVRNSFLEKRTYPSRSQNCIKEVSLQRFAFVEMSASLVVRDINSAASIGVLAASQFAKQTISVSVDGMHSA